MVKVAIFDFDGTLANTLPDLKITINLVRERYGLAPVTEEDVLRHVNNHIPRYIELMLPELCDAEKWREAEQTYYRIYDDHYLDETVPYDGIPEIPVTGIYDENTRDAVYAVEAQFGIPLDGVTGPIVWDVLADIYNDTVSSKPRADGQFSGNELSRGT